MKGQQGWSAVSKGGVCDEVRSDGVMLSNHRRLGVILGAVGAVGRFKIYIHILKGHSPFAVLSGMD